MRKLVYYLIGGFIFFTGQKTTNLVSSSEDHYLVAPEVDSIEEPKIEGAELPLPSHLLTLEASDHLDLSDRDLTELPDSVLRKTHLKTINLSGNEFISFPYELFTLPNLEYIDFTDGVFMEYNELSSLLEQDWFLVLLNFQAKGLKNLGIRFSDMELVVLNSTGDEKCETSDEFYEVISPYDPKLLVNMIRYRGDEVAFMEDSINFPGKAYFEYFETSNLKIYELNNGVSARDFCQFDAIGQHFTIYKETENNLKEFEQKLKDSPWFKLGSPDDVPMWTNQQLIWNNANGDKVISMQKGGC